MKGFCFLFFTIIFFNYAFGQNNSTSEDDCVCVLYYLCQDGKPLTDGRGLIQERLKSDQPCPNVTEVCCRTTEEPVTVTTAPKSVAIPPSCGVRNPDGVSHKIFNNDPAQNTTEFGEFPWMVGILSSSGSYKCGGSLIHPSVVLTAAHCVAGKDGFTVRAGEWDSSNTAENLKHEDRNVSSVAIHEDFQPGIYHNDAALLFLEAPFDLAPHINVVCLPPANAVVDAGRCFTSGWGKNRFGKDGGWPVILKKVDLPMVARDACQEGLRKTRLGRFFQLHRSFVCAGGEEGKDACVGDGGGPLVCPIDGGDERYQEVGIVSWGIGCGDADVPGVYTNVAFLRDWIDKQVKDKNFDTSTYEYK